MKTAPFFFTLAILSLAACKPRNYLDSSQALNVGGESQFYKPISNPTSNTEWTGRLILPNANERNADGGVFFEIHNTPANKTSLAGSRIWLRYKNTPEIAAWHKSLLTNVKFDSITEGSMASGNKHPTRLNGWSSVSPLESLAGARETDNITVLLKNGVLAQPGILEIESEPVMITGRTHALVTFVSSSTDGTHRVRHYNAQSRKFDGPEETVKAIVTKPHSGYKTAQSSLYQIEKSDLNNAGWYIFGEKKNGVFHIGAMEPRRLTAVSPTERIDGREGTLKFVTSGLFAHPKYGSWRVVSADSNSAVRSAQASVGDENSILQSLWGGSETSLVIHTFGWRGGPNGSPAPQFGLNPGHFSFGVAKTVRDRFTGELRFAIEYKQVYAHNRESIVAGSHTYHSYMGNLERGWMYTLPVSDVLIRSPLLYSTYNFGGRVFSPMDALNRELEKMTARYRTGAGNGASVVTPATSCVQDSHAALYAALVKFERAIQQDSSIQKWLAANPGSVEANFMGTNNPHTEYSLPSLIEKVRAQILPHFKIPQFWEENATELAVSRKQLQGFATTLAGLNQSATLFPRSANDFMLTLLVRSFGARLWAIRSDGVGGYLPGLEPIPPTSILVPK